MLRAMRPVIHLIKTKVCGSLSHIPTAHYSACDSSKIKEAPILDNECVLALPEEARTKSNLESYIMMPVMVDLTPINGIPCDQIRTRRVRIYQPVKNVMQSGTTNIRHWEMEFDNRKRWENPLMGWTSSGDPLSSLKLRFGAPAEAIEYCEKNCWFWYMDIPITEREFRPKNYANNFSWNRRSRTSTK